MRPGSRKASPPGNATDRLTTKPPLCQDCAKTGKHSPTIRGRSGHDRPADLGTADGRGPATALTPKVLEHFAVAKPSDLIREVYEGKPRHHALAQVARHVAKARDEGDEVATQARIPGIVGSKPWSNAMAPEILRSAG